MNTMALFHPPFHTTSASIERRRPVFEDAQRLTKKALDRWENEGGKIPEVALTKSDARRPRGRSDFF